MSCLICPSWLPCKCANGPTLFAPKPGPQAQLMDEGQQRYKTYVGGGIPNKTRSAPKINIRQKGAKAERDVKNELIAVLQKVMRNMHFSEEQVAAAGKSIQRNQNQSAVGGNDLSHTFGMSIEVKRQENLQINTWWKQTTAAALPNNELPVLVYRQSHSKWRVVTQGALHLPPDGGSLYGQLPARVEVDWETFLLWFEQWVARKLKSGELPRGVELSDK